MIFLSGGRTMKFNLLWSGLLGGITFALGFTTIMYIIKQEFSFGGIVGRNRVVFNSRGYPLPYQGQEMIWSN